MWREIEGYKFPYRVSDDGKVQKRASTGEWGTITQKLKKDQVCVRLARNGRCPQWVAVSKLVADAFMGGTPSGMTRYHRNRVKWDNSVGNIVFLTRRECGGQVRPGNSRTVLKVDRDGNVVAIYRSTVEAAEKNHISQSAISSRCNREVKDPYRLDGYNYVYEDSRFGRPNAGRREDTP